MRKTKLYLRWFGIPLVVLVVTVILWCFFPADGDSFKVQIIATLLGTGFVVSLPVGFELKQRHLRRKKTFGYLKVNTIPLLEQLHKTFSQTLNSYLDINTSDDAKQLLILIGNCKIVLHNFDKSWEQLVLGNNFFDSIENGDDFYNLSKIIYELKVYLVHFSGGIVNSISLLNSYKLTGQVSDEELIVRTRILRNELIQSTNFFSLKTTEFDIVVSKYLQQQGVVYHEELR